MDVKSFSALPDHLKRELGADPYYLAFKCVISYLVEYRVMRAGHTLSFTCDEDQATAPECYDWYKKLKSSDEGARKKLISFCVADDEHYCALQAADLFAAITRKEAEAQAFGVSNELEDLLKELDEQGAARSLDFQTGLLREIDMKWLADQWKQGIVADLGSRPSAKIDKPE